MFSFTLTHLKLFRGFCMKSAAVLFCVCAFLLAGCDMDDPGSKGVEGLNSDIIGTWTASFGDHYVITEDHLAYYGDSSDTIGWAGTIVAAEEFTEDDGVIIIKYDADHKQTYSEWTNEDTNGNSVLDEGEDTNDNGKLEWVQGDPYPSKGDYIGIYYNDLAPLDTVKLCVAYALADGNEKPTLTEAKAEFTLDNHGTYAGNQPPYTWTAE